MQIQINGDAREISDGATIAVALEALNVPNPQAVGVEVNGEFVESEHYAKHRLQANDSLEIVQFLGGG